MSNNPYFMLINDAQYSALVPASLEFQADRKLLKELVFSVYTDYSQGSDINKIITTYTYDFKIKSGGSAQSPIVFYGEMDLDKVRYYETPNYAAVQFSFLEKK